MDSADDGAPLARSLGAAISALRFTDRTADEVTALLIDTAAGWAARQGFRVYRRARSVVRLPPPFEHQHSFVDLGIARPRGASLVVEVDRSDRRRTVDKLIAEAQAGRIALWVRFGPGPFTPPPAPIHLITCPVTSRRALLTRADERPAPAHTPGVPATGGQAGLFGDPAAPPPPAE